MLANEIPIKTTEAERQPSDSGLDPTFLAKGSLIKKVLVFFASEPRAKSDALRGHSSKLRVRNQVSPPLEPSSPAAGLAFAILIKTSVLMALLCSQRTIADPNFLSRALPLSPG